MLQQYSSFANTFIIFVVTDCSLVVIISYCLNPNSFLKLIAVGPSEFIIIIIEARLAIIYLPFSPETNSGACPLYFLICCFVGYLVLLSTFISTITESYMFLITKLIPISYIFIHSFVKLIIFFTNVQ